MHKETEAGQSSLFGEATEAGDFTPALAAAEPWSDASIRDREKAVLGFYLSSHPLEDDYLEYRAFVDYQLEDLEGLRDGSRLIVGGVISEKPKINTSRNNKLYARVTIEDFTGTVEIIIFADCLDRKKNLLQEGNSILVTGILSTREGEKPSIKANDIFLLKTAYQEIPCRLHLNIGTDDIDNGRIEELDELFRANQVRSEMIFHFREGGIELTSRSRKFAVAPSADLLRKLGEKFGESCYDIEIDRGLTNGYRNNRH